MWVGGVVRGRPLVVVAEEEFAVLISRHAAMRIRGEFPSGDDRAWLWLGGGRSCYSLSCAQVLTSVKPNCHLPSGVEGLTAPAIMPW
jgi:hypothetical protein